MGIGPLFWVLFIVGIVVFGFGLFSIPSWGMNLFVAVLIGLLGWKVFGPAVHS